MIGGPRRSVLFRHDDSKSTPSALALPARKSRPIVYASEDRRFSSDTVSASNIKPDCCCSDFMGTKRIDGRVTASQIAAASLASFLLRLR